MIQHTEVDSGHIASIGHDPISDTLEVKFKNGYLYRGHVPATHHQGMLDADSAGEYYHANIKNNFAVRFY